MKKLTALLLAALLVLAVVGCTKKDEGTAEVLPDKTLDEILTSVEEGVELPAVQHTELTDEDFENFVFVKKPEGAVGMVSEAMMSSVAHSVVLVRLPADADAAAFAKSVEENANPRKWVCVEAEKTAVVQKGNLVLLVMSFEDTADALTANFEELTK